MTTPPLQLDAAGPQLRTAQDAMDLIATTFLPDGADTIVVPIERLTPDFFRLFTGVAGEIVQKFVNYHRHLIVLGDVSVHVARSDAFHGWIREAHRGHDIRFVATPEELAASL